MDHGAVSFLFTGDIEKEREEQLLQVAPDQLNVDILKVPHHGSRTGTTIAFIRAVNPEVAIISCGEGNQYGFPHPKIINTLHKAGAQIYRTDILGQSW
jgi:competence protein ComEC